MGNFHAAIADYDKAIEIDPKNAVVYRNREITKRNIGDWNGAIVDCGKAIGFDPKNAQVYNDRGWAEFQNNDFDAATTDATRSIELNSTNGYAYGTRGWALYAKGEVAEAVEDCNRAIQLSRPDSSEVCLDEGLLHFIKSDYEQAITFWQQGLKKDVTQEHGIRSWINKAKAKLQDKKL